MKENSVIDWLKSHFDNPNLSEQELKPVLYFSLLWNLFEHTYFTDDKHLKPEYLLDLSEISCIHLSDECIDKTFIFFKERYFPQKKLNFIFTTLRLNTNITNSQLSNYDFCQSIFIKKNPTYIEKTKCIFLVIYRFRNNLFHGRKNPKTLNIYKKPFIVINQFLIHFIEKTSDKNSINNQRYII